MRISDWSSDVCSSDLRGEEPQLRHRRQDHRPQLLDDGIARRQDRHHRPERRRKTTLLRLLLGQLQPDSGDVRVGSNPEIAWFDQLRSTLDETKTVWDNNAVGKEYGEDRNGVV